MEEGKKLYPGPTNIYVCDERNEMLAYNFPKRVLLLSSATVNLCGVIECWRTKAVDYDREQ